MECLLQSQSQRVDGPEEALQSRLANGVEGLIDFGEGEHRRQLELLGHAQPVLREDDVQSRGAVVGLVRHERSLGRELHDMID